MKAKGNSPAIFYIDDEKENLLGFKISFSKDFRVLIAQNLVEANAVMDEEEIAVFIVDVKMPDEDGISFVMRIKDQFPDAVFILITAYSDLDLVIKALNNNIFYQYVQKPWNYLYFKSILYNAMEKYNLRLEKKRLMKNLKQSLENEKKANQLKRQFLNNISHEIRTPLNSIIGFAEFAKYEVKDRRVKDYLELVMKSGRSLLDTIENVIDASLIVTRQLQYNEEYFKPFTLVNSIVEDKKLKFLSENDCLIENLIDPELTMCNDRYLVTKILASIIDNAMIHSSGEVKVFCEWIGSNHCWQFKIWNKGYYENLNTDFSIIAPSSSTNGLFYENAKGAGLGLFNARSMASFMGAELWCTSSETDDTSFYLKIGSKNTQN